MHALQGSEIRIWVDCNGWMPGFGNGTIKKHSHTDLSDRHAWPTAKVSSLRGRPTEHTHMHRQFRRLEAGTEPIELGYGRRKFGYANKTLGARPTPSKKIISIHLSRRRRCASNEGAVHRPGVASAGSDQAAQVGCRSSSKAQQPRARAALIRQICIWALARSKCQSDDPSPVSRACAVRSGVDVRVADARYHFAESGHALT